jgi:hypothetical protein
MRGIPVLRASSCDTVLIFGPVLLSLMLNQPTPAPLKKVSGALSRISTPAQKNLEEDFPISNVFFPIWDNFCKLDSLQRPK